MFKANRPVYHSTLSLRIIKKKKLSENVHAGHLRVIEFNLA